MSYENIFMWKADITNPESFTGYVNIPKCPSTWNISYQQIVTESQRTIGKGALLHKELLADKVKYTLSWYYMLPEEFNALIDMFRNHNFFSISCDDSNHIDSNGTRHRRGIVMYGGDMSADILRTDNPDVASGKYPNNDFGNGSILGYTNVTWNLIQR